MMWYAHLRLSRLVLVSMISGASFYLGTFLAARSEHDQRVLSMTEFIALCEHARTNRIDATALRLLERSHQLQQLLDRTGRRFGLEAFPVTPPEPRIEIWPQ